MYLKAFCRVLLCGGLFLGQTAIADALDFKHGLLWKIEKPGQAPSHVFGTIHSEDPRVLAVPQAVQSCLDAAHSLTLEAELEPADIQAFAETLFLPAGQDLQQIMGKDDFQRLSEVLIERELPPEIIARLTPWAAMLLINTPPPKTGKFLDAVLKQRAVEQGKPVYGLESLEEQGQILAAFSQADQLALLRASLDQAAELPETFETLHNYYLARDLAGMMAFGAKQMRFEDADLQARFVSRLIDERNQRMVARMQPYLDTGHAFIAVGALHLPGPHGILSLLNAQGYEISRVY